jgi:hypothetical protein
MQYISWMAAIAKAGGEAINEPDGLVRLPEKDSTRIGRDHAAIEISHHPAPASSSKIDLIRATLRVHWGATSNRRNSFSQNKFTPSEPLMRRSTVRNPGSYVRVVNLEARVFDPLFCGLSS